MKLPKSSGQPKKLKRPLLVRRVMGHSMIPTLPPRTLVIGLTYIRRIVPGQIVIVQHDGREKVKRVSEVKDDQVYLLGDHLDTSTDSRHFGWLPLAAIKAKIIWPRATSE